MSLELQLESLDADSLGEDTMVLIVVSSLMDMVRQTSSRVITPFVSVVTILESRWKPNASSEADINKLISELSRLIFIVTKITARGSLGAH